MKTEIRDTFDDVTEVYNARDHVYVNIKTASHGDSQTSLTPRQARKFAIALLRAADEAGKEYER